MKLHSRTVAQTAAVASESATLATRYHESIFWASHLALLSLLVASRYILIPVVASMMLYTGAIIYIGSHLSLKLKEIDPVTGEKTTKAETLSKGEAYFVPITGSAALLCLYLAYKFLDAYWVNLFLTLYLTAIGVAALAKSLSVVFDKVLPRYLHEVLFSIRYQLRFRPNRAAEERPGCVFEATTSQLIAFAVSTVVAVIWVLTKDFALHNLFAITFSIQAIRLVSVGNFRNAATLLVGLFLYDIFWVFGTNVMVSVAKSFEAPAKILFPTNLKPLQFSLLGLGDIVIPGAFIAMVLRFDYHMVYGDAQDAPKTTQRGTRTSQESLTFLDIHKGFRKLFFWSSMLAYQIGLLVTNVVMLVFKHPQPALLYLVPAAFVGLLVPAVATGKVNAVLSYQEDNEDEDEEEDDEDDARKKQSKRKGTRVAEEESAAAEEQTTLQQQQQQQQQQQRDDQANSGELRKRRSGSRSRQTSRSGSRPRSRNAADARE